MVVEKLMTSILLKWTVLPYFIIFWLIKVYTRVVFTVDAKTNCDITLAYFYSVVNWTKEG
jgi:hypothetical protein